MKNNPTIFCSCSNPIVVEFTLEKGLYCDGCARCGFPLKPVSSGEKAAKLAGAEMFMRYMESQGISFKDVAPSLEKEKEFDEAFPFYLVKVIKSDPFAGVVMNTEVKEYIAHRIEKEREKWEEDREDYRKMTPEELQVQATLIDTILRGFPAAPKE